MESLLMGNCRMKKPYPLSISPKDEDFKEFIQFQSFRPKILFVYFLLKINFVKSWSFSLEILQLWVWEIALLR